ncbi:hypothetical protein BGZ65_012748, partial [Modicella reniformis]
MIEEFFEVYGDYIEAITYILKNGITAPGINIPSVSHLNLADGIDEIREELDLDSQSIQSLIIMTSKANPHWDKSAAVDNDRNALNIIETTDLRPLGYGPGNLRQYFTPDDVKWVCDDHYPEDHGEVIEEQQELVIIGEDLEDPPEEEEP